MSTTTFFLSKFSLQSVNADKILVKVAGGEGEGGVAYQMQSFPMLWTTNSRSNNTLTSKQVISELVFGHKFLPIELQFVKVPSTFLLLLLTSFTKIVHVSATFV